MQNIKSVSVELSNKIEEMMNSKVKNETYLLIESLIILEELKQLISKEHDQRTQNQLTNKKTMKTSEKIGQGYYQSGYGRGFKKAPIVRLINGKAYVKDATQTPFQTDLEGYVMVNALKTGEHIFFAAVGLISEHQQHTY
jgi:hypothetical protein